jgi:hypothetical protein
MLDLLKGGLYNIGLFVLGVLVIALAVLVGIGYLLYIGGGALFLGFMPKAFKRLAKAVVWFVKRFADFPFALLMIAFVYAVRTLISIYDPEAALSFLDVWDKIAQAGLLAAMFSLGFFAFLYFNFREVFRYLYPEANAPKEAHSFKSDYKSLKPWQRLVSIPVFFCLLFWLFQFCLRVMQAVA